MSELAQSRTEAREKGLSRYFTGGPCKYGHIAERTRSGNCVECRRLWRAGRESIAVWRKDYYQKNKKKENENCRQYHLTHKTERGEYGVKYHIAHRRERRLAFAKWRRENQDYCAKHRAAHPDWYQIYAENRRRRKLSGRLSRSLVSRLRKLQRDKCACCGLHLGKDCHLDHIVPLARGGLNIDANMQLLHSVCNSRKGSSDPMDFMRSIGKLL